MTFLTLNRSREETTRSRKKCAKSARISTIISRGESTPIDRTHYSDNEPIISRSSPFATGTNPLFRSRTTRIPVRTHYFDREPAQTAARHGLYAEAIELQEPLVEAHPASLDFRLGLATAHLDAGEHLRMAGKPKAAEVEHLKALEVLNHPGGTLAGDDRFRLTEAMAQINLAAARVERGGSAEGKVSIQRAMDLLLPKADSPDDRAFMAAIREELRQFEPGPRTITEASGGRGTR